jgi:hypothetical protein
MTMMVIKGIDNTNKEEMIEEMTEEMTEGEEMIEEEVAEAEVVKEPCTKRKIQTLTCNITRVDQMVVKLEHQ